MVAGVLFDLYSIVFLYTVKAFVHSKMREIFQDSFLNKHVSLLYINHVFGTRHRVLSIAR